MVSERCLPVGMDWANCVGEGLEVFGVLLGLEVFVQFDSPVFVSVVNKCDAGDKVDVHFKIEVRVDIPTVGV